MPPARKSKLKKRNGNSGRVNFRGKSYSAKRLAAKMKRIREQIISELAEKHGMFESNVITAMHEEIQREVIKRMKK